jgi:hypothetical protein
VTAAAGEQCILDKIGIVLYDLPLSYGRMAALVRARPARAREFESRRRSERWAPSIGTDFLHNKAKEWR